MRHLSILILSILSIQFSYSQIHEIGVFGGGSNFIGDVGSTKYISPNAPALGLLYKWNASSRHSWRASMIYSGLIANDIDSDDPRRIERDYSLNSNLLEISTGMEFTFLPFNLHAGRKIATPYLYSGITFAKHDNYYFPDTTVPVAENTSSWAFGIPMALGIKSNFLGNVIVGVEVGARYTFSNNIDGSMPDSETLSQYRYGNINNNDWYVFSGITLTYTFGENPCYCVE